MTEPHTSKYQQYKATDYVWEVMWQVFTRISQTGQGVEIFHPLVSLSAGLLKVNAGEYASHAAISQRLVEAKKMTKQTSGSSYFIDRRQHTYS